MCWRETLVLNQQHSQSLREIVLQTILFTFSPQAKWEKAFHLNLQVEEQIIAEKFSLTSRPSMEDEKILNLCSFLMQKVLHRSLTTHQHQVNFERKKKLKIKVMKVINYGRKWLFVVNFTALSEVRFFARYYHPLRGCNLGAQITSPCF